MDAAALLRAYNTALGDARTLAALRAASRRFWAGNKGIPFNPARDILDAHRDRVSGKGSPADCDAVTARAIREIGQ